MSAGIDGYSCMITYLQCSDNNRAGRVFNLFLILAELISHYRGSGQTKEQKMWMWPGGCLKLECSQHSNRATVEGSKAGCNSPVYCFYLITLKMKAC